MNPSPSNSRPHISESKVSRTTSAHTTAMFHQKEGQRIKELMIHEDVVEDLQTDGVKTLKQYIDHNQLAALHQRFNDAPKRRMTMQQLREALTTETDARFDGEEFRVLFMKIDGKRRQKVDWDDFVSHLILEFNETYVNTVQERLEVPIHGLPKIIKSRHKRPICKVTFCPAVSAKRVINYIRGSYISCSSEGTINFWNLDMEYERSVSSKSVQLKVAATWVTDVVCLSDVNIICTSSTEGELRFYDTTAMGFEARVVVTSIPSAVVCMYYFFDENIERDSRLICGHCNGSVTVYSFNAYQKGPFHHTPGIDTRIVRYERVAKGDLDKMRVVEFPQIHQDWVRQVYFYSALNSFVSCGICPDNSVYICDCFGVTTKTAYNVTKGVTCFYVDETSHTLATGGPDCIVRVWSSFVPGKALSVLQGHHACLVCVIMQEAGKRVVSMSKDRCVKVWDVTLHNCVQTYTLLPPTLGDNMPMAVYYNPMNHSVVIGCLQIAIIICDKLVSEDTTDGTTHRYDVTCVLYNPLFEILVTVGTGSMIMVWNLWLGKRKQLIKEAHTRVVHGERVTVAITVAEFDPDYQLLLTGARDGSIKMWNFNTGSCVRNLSIQAECEVSSLLWLPGRILAIGWNRRVVEFLDTGKLTEGKLWEMCHTSDVLCAAKRAPQCLATGSYTGELVLWRLETGQPYRRYNVATPTAVVKLDYVKRKSSGTGRLSTAALTRMSRTSTTFAPRKSISNLYSDIKRLSISSSKQREAVRRMSEITLPGSCAVRTRAIHTLLFLCTRDMQPDTGTLLAAVDSGHIQIYSHHVNGRYIDSFVAVHTFGDYVVALATDPENKYLFTGTTEGYIKIWLMENYALPHPVRVCLPQIRLQFPFMWRDRFTSRAKRAVREQPLPMLLSSYRGHSMAVMALEYLAQTKILITSSADLTVRFWSLGGQYLNTLGSLRPWEYITPGVELSPDYPFRVPPDMKRVSSSTTLRVLYGGKPLNQRPSRKTLQNPEDRPHVYSQAVVEKCVYGNPLKPPILGNHFSLPSRPDANTARLILDQSMPHIPVYCHLDLHNLDVIPRPSTPPALLARQNMEQQMDEKVSFVSKVPTKKSNLSSYSASPAPSLVKK